MAHVAAHHPVKVGFHIPAWEGFRPGGRKGTGARPRGARHRQGRRFRRGVRRWKIGSMPVRRWKKCKASPSISYAGKSRSSLICFSIRFRRLAEKHYDCLSVEVLRMTIIANKLMRAMRWFPRTAAWRKRGCQGEAFGACGPRIFGRIKLIVCPKIRGRLWETQLKRCQSIIYGISL